MQTLDKTYVEERVNRWRERLGNLFTTIEEYYQRLPDRGQYELLRGQVLQPSEPPLTRFEVAPQMLPTIAIVSGRSRVSFVPSSLWVVGANGRVNVTTNQHLYMLVDLGADEVPDWRLVTSRLKDTHKPFDYAIFQELVERGEIG